MTDRVPPPHLPPPGQPDPALVAAFDPPEVMDAGRRLRPSTPPLTAGPVAGDLAAWLTWPLCVTPPTAAELEAEVVQVRIDAKRAAFLDWLNGRLAPIFTAHPWQEAAYQEKYVEAQAAIDAAGAGSFPLIEANAALDGETVVAHATRVVAERNAFKAIAVAADPARRSIQHGAFADVAAIDAEIATRRAAVEAAIAAQLGG